MTHSFKHAKAAAQEANGRRKRPSAAAARALTLVCAALRIRRPRAACLAALVCVGLGAAHGAWATAPAGTVITARATATYIPHGYTQQETVSSNDVVARVRTVEALDLAQDQSTVRPPGTTVRFSHVLRNTGNVGSRYTFTLTNGGAGCAADDLDLSGLRLAREVSPDGAIDASDQLLPLGTAGALSLEPGQVVALLVEGTLPPGASTGRACITLTARADASGGSDTNVDTVDATVGAALVVTKSASHPDIVQPGLTTIDFTITTSNIGAEDARPAAADPLGTRVFVDGAPRSLLLLRDVIPAGTTYVPGSLKTNMSDAVLLLRLPGDPPFTYRTATPNTPDEVAIGLPGGVQSSHSASMSFSVRVRADAGEAVRNAGFANYATDVGANVQEASNTVVVPLTIARVGIAKAASSPVAQVDAQGALDGTIQTRFTLRARNYGTDTVYDAQITDVVEGGGTSFGTYTSAAVPAEGEYTIVPGTLRIVKSTGARASLRTDFTGQAARAQLLAASAQLTAGGEITIEFDVRFNGLNRPGVLYNSARAQAAFYPSGPPALSDDSADGADPDPDSDGDPGNNASPTPIAAAPPRLTLTKSVMPPRRTDTPGIYELDYALTVANAGGTPAPYVRVIDNLDCTFRMDQADTPVAAWELVGAPQFSDNVLQSFAGFTGKTRCDRSAAAGSDATARVPTAMAVSLTDGSSALEPGKSETIRFTVRITLKPEAIGARVQLENTAWAASFDKNVINTVQAAVLAVASASADVLLSDPQGVVYNAITREPVPGAIVSMRRQACTSGSVTPIVADEIYYSDPPGMYTFNADGSVSMVTPASGEYQFFFRSPPIDDLCTYSLTVEPPADSGLKAPSTLIPQQSGSFDTCGAVVPGAQAPRGPQPTTWYASFRAGRNAGTGELCDVIHNHVPLDPQTSGGLVLRKEGSKVDAEFGDFVDYTLSMTNKSGIRLVGLRFADRLPPGFAYEPGSTRLNGAPVADPAGGRGPDLVFDYPRLAVAAEERVEVRYRLRVGVGAPIGGDAINRAAATSGDGATQLASNEAVWRLRVSGGVFSEEGFLFGKVFLDCDGDGIQGYEEVGVPGARIFLEDGTSVVTDVEGKWSLYGLKPVTHVAKLDPLTLPPGARLARIDNRQGGAPGSRFIDLQKGELHKVNFAIGNCHDDAVEQNVYERRKFLALRPDAEGEAARLRARLDPQGKRTEVADARSLPASGKVLPDGSLQQAPVREAALIELPGATVYSNSAPVEPFVPVTGPTSMPAPEDVAPAATQARPLEEVMPELDDKLDFLDIKNRDVAPTRQLTVRVKGALGTTLRLRLNGVVVSDRVVGKKATLVSKRLIASEYIALPLRPGENTFELEALDEFGGVREARTITVVAPGNLARLEIDVPATARADGNTPVPVNVKLVDADGVPVTIREPITLEASTGRWRERDLNPKEPGTQQFIEGGAAQFALIPPAEPGDGRVRISVNGLERDARVAFLPDLRALTGVGVLEGVINLSSRGSIALGAPRARDAFEAELRGWSRESGDVQGAGRAAFYFKGTVRGEYLLTAAYDSDHEERGRLFRDIRPDEFYPVYGDSAQRTFDAQSTDRLYVRVDKNRSWLLYGDFVSSSSPEVRKLSQTSRALTGLQHQYEGGNLRVRTYASRDSLQQKIEEFPANGTSGPFALMGGVDLLANSERVEIVVRDRDQPNHVLRTTLLERFGDYSVEPLSRRLLLASPVPSLDPDLNPQSIRVTYEVDSGGPQFWVGGIDAQVKVGERLQLGLAGATDEDPDNVRRLGAVTALARLGERTILEAEAAATRSDIKGEGQGARVELRHEGDALKVQVQADKTSPEFDNPSAGIGAGRTEASARAEYKLFLGTRLRSEAIYSADDVGDNARRGAALSVQQTLGEYLIGEVGARVGEQTGVQGGFDYGSVSSAATGSAAASAATSGGKDDFVTMRGRLTARLPASRAQMFIEGEQAIDDNERRVVALGSDYRITPKIRAYGRYELISTLFGGPYSLQKDVENDVGMFGLESEYMRGGRLYSEYRLRDSIDGQAAQSAFGVRHTFTLGEGLRLTGGAEHTGAAHTIDGSSGGEATALTTAFEYTGRGEQAGRLRAGGSLEARSADASETFLNTLGFAYKLDRDWSLLARSTVTESRGRGDDRLLARQQIGFAYRPVDQDSWNALGRYEHRLDRASGSVDEETRTHILSTHLNVQPGAGLYVSGRYAVKWTEATYDDLASSYWAQMLFGRVTRDVTSRMDFGIQAGLLVGENGAQQRTAGVEAGFQLASNLWLSLGYNMLGIDDPDLAGADYVDHGPYLRMRFKFDESLFTRDVMQSAADGMQP